MVAEKDNRWVPAFILSSIRSSSSLPRTAASDQGSTRRIFKIFLFLFEECQACLRPQAKSCR